MSDLFDDSQRARLERRIDEWLSTVHDQHPNTVAACKSPGDDLRWMVRLRGESKEFSTIWLQLGQRTLRYETYVMPYPDENVGEVLATLLRRNERLVGAHYALGAENAIHLVGELLLSMVSDDELDRVVGTLFATVEAQFTGLVQRAFAGRLGGAQ